jgi:hypothetical protein
MSELVSTFLPVSLKGGAEYLFFVVTWNDYVTRISKELEKQWEAFGADLGEKGAVIRAYGKHARSTFAEVKAKGWPEDIQKRFDNEQDPFMLITSKDFKDFDPRTDEWAIIWFSGFDDKPEEIYRVFGRLAWKVEHGKNVFEYAKSLAKKAKFQKLSRYFELAPEIFGVSLDVNAILEDINPAS